MKREKKKPVPILKRIVSKMCLFYGWHFSCSLIDNLCGDWCECHTNSYSVASPPPFGLPVCGVPFQTGKIHCWIVKRLTRRLNSQFQNVREWEPINDCRVCVRQLRAMSLLYIITWVNWATLSNTTMLLVAHFIQLMVIFGDHVVFVSICRTSNENVFIWFPFAQKAVKSIN